MVVGLPWESFIPRVGSTPDLTQEYGESVTSNEWLRIVRRIIASSCLPETLKLRTVSKAPFYGTSVKILVFCSFTVLRTDLAPSTSLCSCCYWVQMLLASSKNQATRVVERKVSLFKMPAFWEDGGLLKGHCPILALPKGFILCEEGQTKGKRAVAQRFLDDLKKEKKVLPSGVRD